LRKFNAGIRKISSFFDNFSLRKSPSMADDSLADCYCLPGDQTQHEEKKKCNIKAVKKFSTKLEQNIPKAAIH